MCVGREEGEEIGVLGTLVWTENVFARVPWRRVSVINEMIENDIGK